jgi:hypothetical protein
MHAEYSPHSFVSLIRYLSLLQNYFMLSPPETL